MTDKELDVAYELADFVYNTGFDDIPDRAIEATKVLILDTTAVAAAGVCASGISELIDLVRADCGKGLSKVLFKDLRIPPHEAALINSSMIHAQDFDDTHDKAHIHAMAMVLPAALAASDEIGKMSGRDLITGLVIGVEVASRLALAPELPRRGWHYTPLCGGFGAVATASKIYGLEKCQIRNALGLMYSRASGNLQAELDNALSKRMQPGFSSQCALLSVKMAQSGITGAENIFEGEAGYFHLYQNSRYDRDSITDALGESFEVTEISLKPYPCCRLTHPAIDAALEIRNRSSFALSAIAQIKAKVTEQTKYEVCAPEEHKRNPRGIVDAQFSLPYTVAAALKHGEVSLNDFTRQAIENTETIALANKVSCCVDTQIESESRGEIASCKLEVELDTGKCLDSKIRYPKGHPLNPMTVEEVKEKAMKCAEFCNEPPSRTKMVEMYKEIMNMENSTNVLDIFL